MEREMSQFWGTFVIGYIWHFFFQCINEFLTQSLLRKYIFQSEFFLQNKRDLNFIENVSISHQQIPT